MAEPDPESRKSAPICGHEEEQSPVEDCGRTRATFSSQSRAGNLGGHLWALSKWCLDAEDTWLARACSF